MRQINVIGTSCAGKTTFAASLAAAMGIAHVELDALHWEPGWVEVSADVFRGRVAAATAGDAWVVDGNYSVVRDIVWPRVDTLVWLDYALPLVLWRATRRTLRRAFLGEPCCNGNRESLGRSLSRDSIILWVLQTHAQRRREFGKLLPECAGRGIKVVILRTPNAAERWLREVRRENGVRSSR
jgi:adenylate kinase family enzyme